MTLSSKRVFIIFSLLRKTGIKLQNMLFVSSFYKETQRSFFCCYRLNQMICLRFLKLLWITYTINLLFMMWQHRGLVTLFATTKKKRTTWLGSWKHCGLVALVRIITPLKPGEPLSSWCNNKHTVQVVEKFVVTKSVLPVRGKRTTASCIKVCYPPRHHPCEFVALLNHHSSLLKPQEGFENEIELMSFWDTCWNDWRVRVRMHYLDNDFWIYTNFEFSFFITSACIVIISQYLITC